MGKPKKIPVWNSLVARHGEKGFFHDPSRATLQWHLYYGGVGAIFGFFAWLTSYTLYSYILIGGFIAGLIFFYHQFLYLDEPTNKQFLIVYEDEIVIGASEMSWGPGMVRLPRNEYRVEIIARDAEVYDMEKCNEYYVAIFNKPVRGTNFVRMNSIEFNVTSETVRKLASILNVKKLLLDGYYYPTTYAVFKMICGDEAPDLAEALLKDYTEEVKKHGHWKVSSLMNALRSLCLAKKKKEAIKLAEMIATGEAFEKLDKIDEKEYLETWFEPGIPCYPNNQKRNKTNRAFVKECIPRF